MRLTETPLRGAYLIDLEPRVDSRGFFARAFCARELGDLGLETTLVQANDSLSHQKGTLRGLHYQIPPHAEVKLVRCIRGALFDVIVDLRRDSPTRGHWFGAELTSENRRMLYVPKGFAHGFLTAQDDTEAFYLVSEPYAPDHERGVRWDDPFFAIRWPATPTAISDKDRSIPDFDPSLYIA